MHNFGHPLSYLVRQAFLSNRILCALVGFRALGLFKDNLFLITCCSYCSCFITFCLVQIYIMWFDFSSFFLFDNPRKGFSRTILHTACASFPIYSRVAGLISFDQILKKRQATEAFFVICQIFSVHFLKARGCMSLDSSKNWFCDTFRTVLMHLWHSGALRIVLGVCLQHSRRLQTVVKNIGSPFVAFGSATDCFNDGQCPPWGALQPVSKRCAYDITKASHSGALRTVLRLLYFLKIRFLTKRRSCI